MKRPPFDFAKLHPSLVERFGHPEPPKCTYCGGSDFLQGPTGMVSTNILCADIACRHWFNHQAHLGLDDLHRQEPEEEMDV